MFDQLAPLRFIQCTDKGNLDLTELKRPEMLQYEYARSGLKIGVKLEQELGVNPYKFGLIGSTDSHTSLATADEDNFFGKHSGAEPSPTRATHPFLQFADGKVQLMGWEMTASGYAAVWATENTSKAIFDALMRKEVNATTGPRTQDRASGRHWRQSPSRRRNERSSPPSPSLTA